MTSQPVPDRKTDVYWNETALTALSLAHCMNRSGDITGSARLIADHHHRYGIPGVNDISAILFSMAYAGCPPAFRTADGAPDADLILKGTTFTAEDVVASTVNTNQLIGRPGFTEEHLTRTEAHLLVFQDCAAAVRAAVAAGPEAENIAAAIQPAATDPLTATSVLGYAVCAVRNVEAAEEETP